MKKLILALLTLCGVSHYAQSQGILFNPDLIDYGDPGGGAKLYTIKPGQQNHHFVYSLPNDGTLLIDFLRLSDWGSENKLSAIAATAAGQVAHFRDSFRSATSAKTISINIPIDEQVLSVNYSEDLQDQNQMAYKNGTYYRLKTSFDTLRIVKNVAVRTKPHSDSGLIQVQYTFILKNLDDIRDLVKDPDLLPRLGSITDSVIARKRKTWRKQDGTGHNVTLFVDANKNDSMSVRNNINGDGFQRIGLSVSLGAITYNSAISPYGEIGIAYLFPGISKTQPFIGFNMGAFGLVSTNGKTLSTTKGGYATYSLEMGICRKGMSFMSGKTSILLGIMTVHDEKSLFNMGINVAVSRLASIGLNLGANFKKAENGGRYVYGINFKFNY